MPPCSAFGVRVAASIWSEQPNEPLTIWWAPSDNCEGKHQPENFSSSAMGSGENLKLFPVFSLVSHPLGFHIWRHRVTDGNCDGATLSYEVPEHWGTKALSEMLN